MTEHARLSPAELAAKLLREAHAAGYEGQAMRRQAELRALERAADCRRRGSYEEGLWLVVRNHVGNGTERGPVGA